MKQKEEFKRIKLSGEVKEIALNMGKSLKDKVDKQKA